jgi:hypothetical protein
MEPFSFANSGSPSPQLTLARVCEESATDVAQKYLFPEL